MAAPVNSDSKGSQTPTSGSDPIPPPSVGNCWNDPSIMKMALADPAAHMKAIQMANAEDELQSLEGRVDYDRNGS